MNCPFKIYLVHLFVVGLSEVHFRDVILINDHLTTVIISWGISLILKTWLTSFKLDAKMHVHTVHFLSGPGPPPCECHGCWHVCDGRSEGSGPGHCALVMAERHHRLPSVHPRDPCLTDSPSCTHHPHPLLGAVEGCNSSSISLFYCLLYCSKKVHFFSAVAGGGFSCWVNFCSAVMRCKQ